ncbi:hypothetical protein STEG23_030178 [Scotinomys teguina]
MTLSPPTLLHPCSLLGGPALVDHGHLLHWTSHLVLTPFHDLAPAQPLHFFPTTVQRLLYLLHKCKNDVDVTQ